MNPLDRVTWAICDRLARLCTSTAFALSLLAAVVLVGAIEGIR